MNISNRGYQRLAQRLAPRSNTPVNCAKAFVVGGAICLLGQGLKSLYLSLGAGEKPAALLCSVSLIFLSALLTGLGLYDDLAKQGGAGTLCPSRASPTPWRPLPSSSRPRAGSRAWR